jgi:FKBP-type peptidyl-prolyl cis-trans isomerase
MRPLVNEHRGMRRARGRLTALCTPVAALLLIVLPARALAQQPDLSAPPDLTSPPADALTSSTGLKSRVLMSGTGAEKPGPEDVVTVHYTGWASDGRMIDTSTTKNNPVMLPLKHALAGWRECVQLMVLGERRRCWIPQNLSYRGQEGRPTGTIVFDVDLIDTRPSPVTPPANVAAPPEDAARTASGLAFIVLRPGTGARNPAAFNRVTVHYTGWTTDGMMFDSSVTRGTATTMSLDQVIPGWTEGVQLMVEGERRRFWIPEDLAYKGESGSPKGMLVFDIDLVRIE